MIRNSQNNLEAMLQRYRALGGEAKLNQGILVANYMRNVRVDILKRQIDQLRDKQLLNFMLSFGAKGDLTQHINARLARL